MNRQMNLDLFLKSKMDENKDKINGQPLDMSCRFRPCLYHQALCICDAVKQVPKWRRSCARISLGLIIISREALLFVCKGCILNSF